MFSFVKKVFSTLLIIIFLYNVLGYFFVFAFKQSANKKFVKNELNKEKTNHLIVIKLSITDKKTFNWESDDEIRINNKLYDVISKKQNGNELILYCYNDTKEESLFASLENHIKNYLDFNSPAGSESKTKVKNPLTEFLNEFSRHSFVCLKTFAQENTFYHFSVTDFKIKYPDPPPR